MRAQQRPTEAHFHNASLIGPSSDQSAPALASSSHSNPAAPSGRPTALVIYVLPWPSCSERFDQVGRRAPPAHCGPDIVAGAHFETTQGGGFPNPREKGEIWWLVCGLVRKGVYERILGRPVDWLSSMVYSSLVEVRGSDST